MLLLLVACADPKGADSPADTADCTPTAWYDDADDDGFGEESSRVDACEAPPGAVADAGDCDDDDPAVFPGAEEVCDGVDDNCDGLVDEADPALTDAVEGYEDRDGDGVGGAATARCDITGLAAAGGDCDDDEAAVYPGAPEACDGVDSDCAGDEDLAMVSIVGGATWTDLGEAVAASEAGDELRVCPGTWVGGIRVEHDLALTGVGGRERVVVEGAGGAVFTVEGAALRLVGLGVRGGVDEYGHGGGVAAAAATAVEIEDCAFSGNGAMYGGGVYGPERGELHVSHSRFEGNWARAGGAAVILAGAVTDSEIVGNEAEGGGGLLVWGVEGSVLDLRGTLFEANVATATGGALATGGRFDILGGTLRGNRSAAGGGLAAADQVGTLTGMVFEANEAEYGGGLFVDSDAELVLDGCTVDGNVAEGWGGGIYAADAGLRLVQGAVTANEAGEGGGFCIDGEPALLLEEVDLGAGAADNTPSDLYLGYFGQSWSELGAGTSMACDVDGCR